MYGNINGKTSFTVLYASDDVGSTVGELYQVTVSVHRMPENIVAAIVNVRNLCNKFLL